MFSLTVSERVDWQILYQIDVFQAQSVLEEQLAESQNNHVQMKLKLEKISEEKENFEEELGATKKVCVLPRFLPRCLNLPRL